MTKSPSKTEIKKQLKKTIENEDYEENFEEKENLQDHQNDMMRLITKGVTCEFFLQFKEARMKYFIANKSIKNILNDLNEIFDYQLAKPRNDFKDIVQTYENLLILIQNRINYVKILEKNVSDLESRKVLQDLKVIPNFLIGTPIRDLKSVKEVFKKRQNQKFTDETDSEEESKESFLKNPKEKIINTLKKTGNENETNIKTNEKIKTDYKGENIEQIYELLEDEMDKDLESRKETDFKEKIEKIEIHFKKKNLLEMELYSKMKNYENYFSPQMPPFDFVKGAKSEDIFENFEPPINPLSNGEVEKILTIKGVKLFAFHEKEVLIFKSNNSLSIYEFKNTQSESNLQNIHFLVSGNFFYPLIPEVTPIQNVNNFFIFPDFCAETKNCFIGAFFTCHKSELIDFVDRLKLLSAFHHYDILKLKLSCHFLKWKIHPNSKSKKSFSLRNFFLKRKEKTKIEGSVGKQDKERIPVYGEVFVVKCLGNTICGADVLIPEKEVSLENEILKWKKKHFYSKLQSVDEAWSKVYDASDKLLLEGDLSSEEPLGKRLKKFLICFIVWMKEVQVEQIDLKNVEDRSEDLLSLISRTSLITMAISRENNLTKDN